MSEIGPMRAQSNHTLMGAVGISNAGSPPAERWNEVVRLPGLAPATAAAHLPPASAAAEGGSRRPSMGSRARRSLFSYSSVSRALGG
eukprot:8356618-Pyramimonas_sp.AAC.1